MADPRSQAEVEQAEALATLFHNRWSTPVIAELDRDKGAKFITLLNRLGCSRDALSRTLKAVVEVGLAMRNPGQGHPMRPEYILTPAGRRVGKHCRAYWDLVEKLGISDEMLRKWSAPVVWALSSGASRFQEVATLVPAATPRALAQTLKLLAEVDVVERELVDDYPPRPRYALARRAKGLSEVCARLAKVLAGALPASG